MPTTRAAFAAALLLAACVLPACSVRPSYGVRVVNGSGVPIAASIVNTRSITRPETLAHARVAPGDEAVLGPVQAQPMERVELQIDRPGDMGTIPVRQRLSRGNWAATVTGGSDSWDALSVAVEKD